MHSFGYHGGQCRGIWAARRFGRHGGRGPGWGPGAGGGGSDWFRVGRMLAQGDLKLLALALIAEQPRHGYELIKAVEESVGGAYSPSPGVVYPTLSLLEDMGYTRAEEAEGGKKLYAVTPEGAAFLEAQAPAIALLLARMEEAAVAGRGRNAPQIMRAMGNLGMALQLRLSRGPLSEEQIQAVAAAIDAAAQAVERA